MEKKYKFITIKPSKNGVFTKTAKGQHPLYVITNNRGGDIIGILSFYGPWKQYVFESGDAVFNDSCLRDVLDFMDKIKQGVV